MRGRNRLRQVPSAEQSVPVVTAHSPDLEGRTARTDSSSARGTPAPCSGWRSSWHARTTWTGRPTQRRGVWPSRCLRPRLWAGACTGSQGALTIEVSSVPVRGVRAPWRWSFVADSPLLPEASRTATAGVGSVGDRFWGQVRGSPGRRKVVQGKGATRRETKRIAGKARGQANFQIA
jgi:hypothetical protein